MLQRGYAFAYGWVYHTYRSAGSLRLPAVPRYLGRYRYRLPPFTPRCRALLRLRFPATCLSRLPVGSFVLVPHLPHTHTTPHRYRGSHHTAVAVVDATTTFTTFGSAHSLPPHWVGSPAVWLPLVGWFFCRTPGWLRSVAGCGLRCTVPAVGCYTHLHVRHCHTTLPFNFTHCILRLAVRSGSVIFGYTVWFTRFTRLRTALTVHAAMPVAVRYCGSALFTRTGLHYLAYTPHCCLPLVLRCTHYYAFVPLPQLPGWFPFTAAWLPFTYGCVLYTARLHHTACATPHLPRFTLRLLRYHPLPLVTVGSRGWFGSRYAHGSGSHAFVARVAG